MAGVATAGAAMMAELRSVPLGRWHEPRSDWWSAPVPTTRDAAMLGAALNFLLRLRPNYSRNYPIIIYGFNTPQAWNNVCYLLENV